MIKYKSEGWTLYNVYFSNVKIIQFFRLLRWIFCQPNTNSSEYLYLTKNQQTGSDWDMLSTASKLPSVSLGKQMFLAAGRNETVMLKGNMKTSSGRNITRLSATIKNWLPSIMLRMAALCGLPVKFLVHRKWCWW